MQEFKGTRGKWNVELKTEMISIHTGDNSQEVLLSEGIWHDPNICGIWAHIAYKERHICEANAKLIAAAPELLEALQEAAKQLHRFLPTTTFTLRKAESAINKALGL